MASVRIGYLLSVLLISLFLTNCFGGFASKGSVKSYYNGLVRTDGGSFRLGILPKHWKKKKIKYRALLFENKKDRSTIAVDSFCRNAVDGGNLVDLTNNSLRGLKDFKVTDQHLETLDNREALLTEGHGIDENRQVFLSYYVLKMNQCVFDFMYVTFPGETDYLSDFKSLVKGFQYIEGPDPI